MAVVSCSNYASSLFAAGQREASEKQFAHAERQQGEINPETPLLYSMRGYLYCDLLLSKQEWTSVSSRADAVEKHLTGHNVTALDRALLRLWHGRSHFGRVLASIQGIGSEVDARERPQPTSEHLDEAVDLLRASGARDDVPRGLLARATFLRNVGSWSGAARDLDEVEEIAEPGPMRLYLCDMALERARLAFAQIEAFAPLNGMLEKDNSPKPQVPSAERIAELRIEAEKQIMIADDYIQSCGYHRRDEELAELKDVLAGKRTFASLPPHV